MFLIVCVVVASGVGLSKLFLEMGVRSMAWRYPLALVGSYAVLFVLVRIWLWYVTGRGPSDPELDGDLGGDWSFSGGGGQPFEGAQGLTPGGGSFGGGGASESWGSSSSSASSSSSGGGGGGGGFSLDGDLGELVVVVLLVAFVAVLVGGGIYLVYEAPVILSEAAFEFLLASGLLRVSRRVRAGEWSGSVLRSTWIPFAGALLLAVLLGAAAGHACPTAVKMAQVLACLQQD
jgi:hypothetical protein